MRRGGGAGLGHRALLPRFPGFPGFPGTSPGGEHRARQPRPLRNAPDNLGASERRLWPCGPDRAGPVPQRAVPPGTLRVSSGVQVWGVLTGTGTSAGCRRGSRNRIRSHMAAGASNRNTARPHPPSAPGLALCDVWLVPKVTVRWPRQRKSGHARQGLPEPLPTRVLGARGRVWGFTAGCPQLEYIILFKPSP